MKYSEIKALKREWLGLYKDNLTNMEWREYINHRLQAQNLARITAENIALCERVESQNKFIKSMEWDETTGDCLMGCGGRASDGHLSDCQYIGKLVEFGLMTIEEQSS